MRIFENFSIKGTLQSQRLVCSVLNVKSSIFLLVQLGIETKDDTFFAKPGILHDIWSIGTNLGRFDCQDKCGKSFKCGPSIANSLRLVGLWIFKFGGS